MLVKNRQTNNIIELDINSPTMRAEEFIGNLGGFAVDGFRSPTAEDHEADDRDYDYIADTEVLTWWISLIDKYNRIEELLAKARDTLDEVSYTEIADEVAEIYAYRDPEDWAYFALPILRKALGYTK